MESSMNTFKPLKYFPRAAFLASAALLGASAISFARPSLPSALVGNWSVTSTSGTTYWDSSGAYKGGGGGGSMSYTFFPNGRYKLFSLIKTNSYGWETQALTWEEGTTSVAGSRLSLRPTSGRYQVIDNRVARRNYKRAMRASERKPKTVTWKIDSSGARSVLTLGSTSYTRQGAEPRRAQPRSSAPRKTAPPSTAPREATPPEATPRDTAPATDSAEAMS
jgi:hypothetical protein